MRIVTAVSPSFIKKCTVLSAVKMPLAGLIRIIAGTTGLLAGLGALLIAFSTGGIERDGMQTEAAR